MQKSGQVALKTAERRRFILDLRKAGLTYAQIVEQAIKKFGTTALPRGFDERYAYKDVKLTEAERKKTDEILTEFSKEAYPAYFRGEYKVVNDLKKDTEKRLKRVVGNKRTRDIMNNVNRQMGRRGGWGGR